MKQQSALTLLTAICIIFSTSCKKDKESQRQDTLLTQYITSSETTTYSYDDNNRATGYAVENIVPSYNYTAAYSYNSSGQLTEVRYNPANSIEDTKDVYTYNSNGQLMTMESFYVTNTYSSLFAKYEADYSTTGRVKLYRYSSAGAGIPFLNTEYILDNKGNVVQQLTYDTGGNLIVTTENADFDNKKLPSMSLQQTGFVQSTHNYGKVTVTPTGGSSSVTTYVYEYDSDGFPTKRTASTGAIVRYTYVKK